MLKKLFCKLFGHVPTRVNVRRRVAICDRCGVGLRVTYDMSYGETIVESEIPRETALKEARGEDDS